MLPPARGDEVPKHVFCCRSAVVFGFHVFHACFSDDKLLVVAVDACVVLAKHSGLDVEKVSKSICSVAVFACVVMAKHSGLDVQKVSKSMCSVAVFACVVSAKHSGLDVRLCENQCVRLQLLRALYGPSHFLGQLRNFYFSIKSLGIDHVLGQLRNWYFSIKYLLGIYHFLG